MLPKSRFPESLRERATWRRPADPWVGGRRRGRHPGSWQAFRESTFPCTACGSAPPAEAPLQWASHPSYPSGPEKGHKLQASEMHIIPRMSLPLHRISATQHQTG